MRYKDRITDTGLFSRRAFFVTLFSVLLFLIIIVRLFFLQILKSSKYKSLSERNSIKLLLLEPQRGLIRDRNSLILAENRPNYRVYYYKQKGREYKNSIHKLSKILDFSEEELEKKLSIVQSANYITPILILENLSWEKTLKTSAHLYDMPGVYVDDGYARFYPFAEKFAHIIGYTSTPSQNDVKEYKLFHNKEFKLGKAGVEKTKNDNLLGEFGSKRVEVNVHRIVVRDLSVTKSVPGKDVILSLDSKLQNFVYSSIADRSGAVIVSDIASGKILSLVSTPSFNPNLFSRSIDMDFWQRLMSDNRYPLINKSVSKLYPPGSVWKIVVALAILDSKVDPQKKIFCKGHTGIGNRTYNCWQEAGHGYVDLHDAIMKSCNVYFYETARNISIDSINRIASVLGFGEKSNIELTGELSGVNPSKEWKKRVIGKDWRFGDTVNACVGQGYNLVTPMQMNIMMSRVISGLKISPSVFMDTEASQFEKLDIAQDHLNFVKNGMISAFNTQGGTGYSTRITEENFAFGGKTGTAQVVSHDTLKIANKHIKSHSLFAGFAPIHAPKYSISVVVDHAGWGSIAAAPLAKEVLLFAQKENI